MTSFSTLSETAVSETEVSVLPPDAWPAIIMQGFPWAGEAGVAPGNEDGLGIGFPWVSVYEGSVNADGIGVGFGWVSVADSPIAYSPDPPIVMRAFPWVSVYENEQITRGFPWVSVYQGEEIPGNAQTWCHNLRAEGGLETTRFTGAWAFELGLLRIGSKLFGVRSSGLYPIGADTDAGAKIHAHWETHENPWLWQGKKKCAWAYLGVNTNMAVIPWAAGRKVGSYPTDHGLDGTLRAQLPGGVKEVLWAFGFENVNGKDFQANGFFPRFKNLKRWV